METPEDCADVSDHLTQYKCFSSLFLRQRIKHRMNVKHELEGDCQHVYATMLFADISGFTLLSSRLNAEELKVHINQYFSLLLRIIRLHGGDVIKFCGDAVLIMWPVPLHSNMGTKGAAALLATLCALHLLEECGHYKSQRSGGEIPTGKGQDSEQCVELSLHCGVASGPAHCMILGGRGRCEYIVTGSIITAMGEAESCASSGQVCLHYSSYGWIANKLHGEIVGKATEEVEISCGWYNSSHSSIARGIYLVLGCLARNDNIVHSFLKTPAVALFDEHTTIHSHKTNQVAVSSPLLPREKAETIIVEENANASLLRCAVEKKPSQLYSVSISDIFKAHSVKYLQRKLCIKDDKNVRAVLYYLSHYERPRAPESVKSSIVPQTSKRSQLALELRKFIHTSALSAIESRTSALMSEMRDVATVFVQFQGDELLSDLALGHSALPQRIVLTVLRTVELFGGSLRQFVVDDKGCVAILCFGLLGVRSCESSSSYNSNNCVRAVLCSMYLQKLLRLNEDVPCFLGIAYGKVYCGTVGAGDRCEFAVMGRSVNLAARLMSACSSAIINTDSTNFTSGILVDSEVHRMSQDELKFTQLLSIKAKGYIEPVIVFAPLTKPIVDSNFSNGTIDGFASPESAQFDLVSIPSEYEKKGDCKRHLSVFKARHASICMNSTILRVSSVKSIDPLERRRSMPFLGRGESNTDRQKSSANMDIFKRRSSIMVTPMQQFELKTIKRNREYEFMHVLDKLSNVSVAVLKAASIVGVKFSIHVLQAALVGMDLSHCAQPEPLQLAIKTLLEVELIEILNDTQFTSSIDVHYIFCDEIFQQTVYGLMLSSQKLFAHSVVASYLERRYRHSPHMLGAIAYHYAKSNNAKKQSVYLRLASSLSYSKNEHLCSIAYLLDLIALVTGKSDLELLADACNAERLMLEETKNLIVSWYRTGMQSSTSQLSSDKSLVVNFSCWKMGPKVFFNNIWFHNSTKQVVPSSLSLDIVSNLPPRLFEREDLLACDFAASFLLRKDINRKYTSLLIGEKVEHERFLKPVSKPGLLSSIRQVFARSSGKIPKTYPSESDYYAIQNITGESTLRQDFDPVVKISIVEKFSVLSLTCSDVAFWFASISMSYFKLDEIRLSEEYSLLSLHILENDVPPLCQQKGGTKKCTDTQFDESSFRLSSIWNHKRRSSTLYRSGTETIDDICEHRLVFDTQSNTRLSSGSSRRVADNGRWPRGNDHSPCAICVMNLTKKLYCDAFVIGLSELLSFCTTSMHQRPFILAVFYIFEGSSLDAALHKHNNGCRCASNARIIEHLNNVPHTKTNASEAVPQPNSLHAKNCPPALQSLEQLSQVFIMREQLAWFNILRAKPTAAFIVLMETIDLYLARTDLYLEWLRRSEQSPIGNLQHSRAGQATSIKKPTIYTTISDLIGSSKQQKLGASKVSPATSLKRLFCTELLTGLARCYSLLSLALRAKGQHFEASTSLLRGTSLSLTLSDPHCRSVSLLCEGLHASSCGMPLLAISFLIQAESMLSLIGDQLLARSATTQLIWLYLLTGQTKVAEALLCSLQIIPPKSADHKNAHDLYGYEERSPGIKAKVALSGECPPLSKWTNQLSVMLRALTRVNRPEFIDTDYSDANNKSSTADTPFLSMRPLAESECGVFPYSIDLSFDRSITTGVLLLFEHFFCYDGCDKVVPNTKNKFEVTSGYIPASLILRVYLKRFLGHNPLILTTSVSVSKENDIINAFKTACQFTANQETTTSCSGSFFANTPFAANLQMELDKPGIVVEANKQCGFCGGIVATLAIYASLRWLHRLFVIIDTWDADNDLKDNLDNDGFSESKAGRLSFRSFMNKSSGDASFSKEQRCQLNTDVLEMIIFVAYSLRALEELCYGETLTGKYLLNNGSIPSLRISFKALCIQWELLEQRLRLCRSLPTFQFRSIIALFEAVRKTLFVVSYQCTYFSGDEEQAPGDSSWKSKTVDSAPILASTIEGHFTVVPNHQKQQDSDSGPLCKIEPSSKSWQYGLNELQQLLVWSKTFVAGVNSSSDKIPFSYCFESLSGQDPILAPIDASGSEFEALRTLAEQQQCRLLALINTLGEK